MGDRHAGAGLALSVLAGLAAAEPPDAWLYGRRLFEELSCGACHAGPEELERFEAPRLAGIGARVAPEWLRTWLRDPAGVRPGTSMPSLFATMSLDERSEAIEELVHFLASLGGPFEDGRPELSAARLERGRRLYHSIGCVACHAAHETPEDLAEPLWSFAGDASAHGPRTHRSLAHLPAKTRADALAEFLLDPLARRPDGRMPDLRLTPDEARDVATYLTTAEVLEGRLDFELSAGLTYRYFEGQLDDELATYEAAEPVRRGTWFTLDELPPHRDEEFGFLFEGFVDVPGDGLWTFATTSDDGSRLWIDGELVVDNGGDHALVRVEGDVELSAGPHAVTLSYYERTGGEGLVVEWSGPGRDMDVIGASVLDHWIAPEREAPDELDEERPFALDPKLAERGRRRFGELGCLACHPLDGVPALPLRRGPPLEGLTGRGGCIDKLGLPGVPTYELGAHQRAELAAFLAAPLRQRAVSPAERLERTLTRLDCRACHARDGVGGPDDRTRPYFRGQPDVDLGDEGRFPPALDHVGWKLRTEWLDAFLTGDDVVRPYLTTRMPRYGEAHVGELAERFAAVDRADLERFLAGYEDEADELPCRPEDVEVGARLAGTTGLGCVQCHVHGPHGSTGIRSVDLTRMAERIDSRWFRQLLLDPKSIGMNTRMPEFLVDGGRSPVTDVFGGDAERQVEALWSALSLGPAMPLPEGLLISNEAFDVVPTDGPRLVSVFLKDVGPRVLLVGSPERVHYAYDVATARLVAAWKGEFFNARGTWYERAGALEKVGPDALAFPRAAAFARVAHADEQDSPPWSELVTLLDARALGRRFDADGWPTFRYELAGSPVVVEESIRPELGPAGPTLVRRLTIRTDEPADDLHLRLASGRTVLRLDPDSSRRWRFDDVEVRVSEPAGDEAQPLALRRDVDGVTDLLLRVDGQRTTAEVRYSW